MTDYLSRLVARAAIDTLAVRPRLGSRFETSEAAAIETLETVEREVEHPSPPRAPLPTPDRHVDPKPTTAVTAAVPSARAQPKARAESPPTAARVVTANPPVGEPPARELSTVREEHVASASEARPVPPETLAAAAAPAQVAFAVPIKAEAAVRPPAELPTAEPASPPVVKEPFVVDVAVRPSAPLPQRRQAKAEPAPGGPTVHVTIGRVEVRAASPAPASPKRRGERTEPAVVPLDEYLRRRSEGSQ